MSLERALRRLALDAASERALRDVLALLVHHEGEWLSAREIAMRTGAPLEDVVKFLPVLCESFVLEVDEASGRYRFTSDAALSYEIQAFERHVDSHHGHIASNVARFRERHGI